MLHRHRLGRAAFGVFGVLTLTLGITATAGGADRSMGDDLVQPLTSGAGLSADVQPRTSAATAADAGVTANVTAPNVVYLDYADGSPAPSINPNACQGTPPKFGCQFASSLKDCQKQIQAYLDKWYADFNVVFTLTRPASGPFYTEVVSSGGGAWCQASANTAGIAPFYCRDLAGGVAYTFMGGQNAKDTAIIISQEQAHLVGLEHTKSTHDVMDPTICPDCDGFEDKTNQIDGDRCGWSTQNSYQRMLSTLGRWPGGVKPTPFGCDPDSVAPYVSILSPANDARVAGTFDVTVRATDDCAVKTVSVKVSPMGLQTSSSAPPYRWTLTQIRGQQTITVTASDASGKSTTTSIVVNAPGADGGVSDAATSSDAGASDAKTSSEAGTTDAQSPDATAARDGGTDATAAVNGADGGGCDVAGGGPGGLALGLLSMVALLMATLRRPAGARLRPRRSRGRR
jgi:hypothetical protein